MKKNNIKLLFIINEKISSDDMIKVNELNLKSETFIFNELTELKLTLKHKSNIDFNIHIKDKVTHSEYL